MGYLFLSVALFAGLTKAYCGKKTSGYTQSINDAVVANVLRMIFCIIIGLVVLLLEGSLGFLKIDFSTLAVSMLSGISTAVFVVSWLLSVKKGAYMLVEIFLMLGVLLPLVLSSIFLNESIQTTDWIGFIILVVAVAIMCSYNNSQQNRLTVSAVLLLIICGIAYGLSDFSQKLFAAKSSDVPASVFNFYTYVFALIVLLPVVLIYKNKNNADSKTDIKKIIWYILIMSVCLFANSYFKTRAAYYISSVQLYPLNQSAALVLSAIMSHLFFKEKLTAKCISGIALALIGILTINVL